ncbi:hypothetical protein PV10_06317 [Exophiala mesophila]|uniref:DUF3500 domain-containing protein n=1 Tax=Exophiala mesophila TaxID=212818 RepID=A0A0D1WRN4_EXOME|nr:uncharacterized protein PV10_06317 [Exophiala mesophila]KIV91820.1 hypothetical protein PV10_06317 [Exophiala mesophila]
MGSVETHSSDTLKAASAQYREYVPDPDHPRVKGITSSDSYKWTNKRLADPWFRDWVDSWERKYNEPFKGITTDGNVRQGLFHLDSSNEDSIEPATKTMVDAAQDLLAIATPEQRKSIQHGLEAPEWRGWSNPEIVFKKHGLRLEEVSEELVKATHKLLQASLSPEGYVKARGCMKVNGFLGKIVNGPKVLNENSYFVSVFGNPSPFEPWGWQLFGHHLCMNCLVVGGQQVISPVFMGAEPNIVDEGFDSGLTLFTEQEALAMSLMAALPESIRESVLISPSMDGSSIPAWRFHRADQRHLGGAFQDNRVIPYEGAQVSTFPRPQQDQVYELIRISLNYLPERALKARMDEIFHHWSETYFAWIGQHGRGDAFYYKIQSPVVMLEFDHHSGVFLANKQAEPFHIHTLVRTPNGNDYGKELVRQFRQRQSR